MPAPVTSPCGKDSLFPYYFSSPSRHMGDLLMSAPCSWQGPGKFWAGGVGQACTHRCPLFPPCNLAAPVATERVEPNSQSEKYTSVGLSGRDLQVICYQNMRLADPYWLILWSSGFTLCRPVPATGQRWSEAPSGLVSLLMNCLSSI